MKRWMKIFIGVVVLLIAALTTLFFLVDANTFRSVVESELTSALGRQVQVGHMHFAPFSGSIVADDFKIADAPRFSAQPFLTAKQLRIGVKMVPLIFSRQLDIRSLEIDQPRIRLVRGSQGVWNFSSLGQGRIENSGSKSAIPDFSVRRFEIRDGGATVENFPVAGGSRVYDSVDLTARNVSLDHPIPFSLNATLPGKGTVSVKGIAGPIDARNAAVTPVDAQISIQGLDPVAAGLLDPALGVSLLASLDAHADSHNGVLHSHGTIRLEHLQLKKNGSPLPTPIDVQYDATQILADRSGKIENAEIHIGSGTVHVDGIYRMPSGVPWVNLNLSAQNMPINDLQALIKSAAVRLPNGSTLQGGSVTFHLNATGSPGSTIVTGPVAVSNSRLVGFDVGSKISGIAALGRIKTGDIADIQSLRMNVRATDRGLKVDHIDAVMPVVGEATGSGTVSPNGTLDFQLVVRVTTATGMGKVGVGLLTKLNGTGIALGGAKGVPMRVRGTANDPVITADMTLLRRKNSPGALIQRLFGRKH